MPPIIKEIRELLQEEIQVKAELSAVPLVRIDTHRFHDLDMHARTQLFSRLFQIKKALKKFSHDDIQAAKNWESWGREVARSAYRASGARIDQKKSVPEDKADFYLMLLFYHLLFEGKPMQAFLALSLGAGALFFEVDSVITPPRKNW